MLVAWKYKGYAHVEILRGPVTEHADSLAKVFTAFNTLIISISFNLRYLFLSSLSYLHPYNLFPTFSFASAYKNDTIIKYLRGKFVKK